MSKGLIVIIILVLIALVVFGQYVGVRNTLVTKNEAVKAAWSQVDIVLQRRLHRLVLGNQSVAHAHVLSEHHQCD